MTFTPDSFMQAEAAVAKIVSEATREIERYEQKAHDIGLIAARLAEMSQAAPTGWLGAVTYINDQVTANPGDADWVDIKGRMDKIVGDFTAAKARVDSAVAALSGI